MSNLQTSPKSTHAANSIASTKRLCLAGLIALGMSGSALGGQNQGEFDGLYVPHSGWTETQEVARQELGEAPNQIGTFKIVLYRDGWDALSADEKKRIRKRWVYAGTLRGQTDVTTFTTDHVLASENRDGAIYTEGDYLLPDAGDPFCASGTPLSGTETVNVVMGTGAFEGLVEGTIQVTGTVNNCPDKAEYLQNNFEVVSGVGGVRFASTASDQ